MESDMGAHLRTPMLSEPAEKPSSASAKAATIAEEAKVVEEVVRRISRLGHRPEARLSMLELPEELPLSSGTVNFMSFTMVRLSCPLPSIYLYCLVYVYKNICIVLIMTSS